MMANCLLRGSASFGWYLRVLELDVVRGARVIDWLVLIIIMYLQTLVEECITPQGLRAGGQVMLLPHELLTFYV
jgi:hypothetical protein